MKSGIITSKIPILDLHGEVASMVPVLVDEFIKSNILMNNKEIRIVHGKSTNILTEVVKKTLKNNKNIESFHLNNWNLGETIVYLK